MSGFQTQAFGSRKKQPFTDVGLLLIFVKCSHVFGWLWEKCWWVWVLCRQAWNLMILMVVRAGPKGRGSWSVGGNSHCSWSSFQQPKSLQELMLATKYNIEHPGINGCGEKTACEIQNRGTSLLAWWNAPQLGGPSTEGLADIFTNCFAGLSWINLNCIVFAVLSDASKPCRVQFRGYSLLIDRVFTVCTVLVSIVPFTCVQDCTVLFSTLQPVRLVQYWQCCFVSLHIQSYCPLVQHFSAVHGSVQEGLKSQQ